MRVSIYGLYVIFVIFMLNVTVLRPGHMKPDCGEFY